ncbi:hypothetical protein KGF54_004298 [Candida jiufengensis]|uniref:uncharacterized protein n=1 Tax=Candida jiufengensis TaxID=497108 RepID=UPI0022254A76|nr:uncharacterized protein KGF54_004298 [Candida jiufengensis]KAI5951224.1 hypothetical protein KGF54_004298 [Candida jiufengensis]
MFLFYLIALFKTLLLVSAQSKEVHNIKVVDSEEIHIWNFTNEHHFQSSNLWKLLLKTGNQSFSQTIINLDEQNQTLFLSSTDPLTFYEFQSGGSITDFTTIVPVSGYLHMENDTSSISHIESLGFGFFPPPGFFFGGGVLLVNLAQEFGLDGLGFKALISGTVICRASRDQTIQIQKRLKFKSLPLAKIKKLVWLPKDKLKNKFSKGRIFHKLKDFKKHKQQIIKDEIFEIESFGNSGYWIKGKWEDLYTFFRYKKLGLLFFNIDEIKAQKPFCESRPEYLQCQVLNR